jgi:CRISPR-associated endonuclease/helicase Cas3
MKTMSEKLPLGDFGRFFEGLHGYKPFSWQTMLMERVATEGWPDLIDLPTASGKTACMDVAIFALAMGLPTPRRIWFVVDRRIVVDEAYERAKDIAEQLQRAKEGLLHRVRNSLLAVAGWPEDKRSDQGLTPLGVARLRGGAPRQVAWSRNPAQPAVITSTIDQLGSRLLFRGYGVGDRMLPIHAALAGNDSLIIVDEAHLAEPFIETVRYVERLRGKPWANEPVDKPLKLVVMSATPPGENEWRVFPALEEREKALGDAVLQKRIRASKPAQLVIASTKSGKGKGETLSADELVAEAAQRAAAFVSDGRQRVAVMVNRVATAVQVIDALGKLLSAEQADVQLVTGRRRPVDRDRFVEAYKKKLQSGSKEKLEKPIVVVTTQCLEVGADFSFDALLTECASLDALRQRFGRLNRLGDQPQPAAAAILARKNDVPADDDLDDEKPLDPIYGNALARTWNWLRALGGTVVDMGIGAMAPAVAEVQAAGRMSSLVGRRRRAPLMLPAYVDLWSQTSPKPALEPEVGLFLHGIPLPGERARPDVRVIWRREVAAELEGMRRDLEAERRALEEMPPVSAEMLTLPLRELREYLNGGKPKAGDDLELGVEAEEKEGAAGGTSLRVWIWRAGELSNAPRAVTKIRPQDVVVLSAGDGSFDSLCPRADTPADAYEWAYWQTKQAVALRVPAVLGEAATVKKEAGEKRELEEVLAAVGAGIEAMPTDSSEKRLAREWMEEVGKLAVGASREWQPPRVVAYGEKEYLLVRKQRKELVEDWAFETDEGDESVSRGDERMLLWHHTGEVQAAASWLSAVLAPELSKLMVEAAQLHDYGKADGRFQNYLAGRRWAGTETQLLAKSGRTFAGRKEREARQHFGVPEGFRHEMLSMQLAARSGELADGERDLVLHLIAAHHGYARPLAPVVEDEAAPAVSIGGLRLGAEDRSSRAEIAGVAHRLDSGVLERFWGLTRRYGWWGFAYLESMLRCADQHASAVAEQEDER